MKRKIAREDKALSNADHYDNYFSLNQVDERRLFPLKTETRFKDSLTDECSRSGVQSRKRLHHSLQGIVYYRIPVAANWAYTKYTFQAKKISRNNHCEVLGSQPSHCSVF